MSTKTPHESGAVSPTNGEPLPIGRPFKQGEEQRERARRAGIKSGEVRRERKTLREELLVILGEEITGAKGKTTFQHAMTAALAKQALRGNVKAYEVIRDTIGEKPSEKVTINLPDSEVISKVEDALFGGDENGAQPG